MIDLYCERLGPGLWAEPINAFTNLAFLVAAFVSWRLADQHKLLSGDTWVLIGLMTAIGIGSGLFHTFANSWSQVLDILDGQGPDEEPAPGFRAKEASLFQQSGRLTLTL